MSQLMGKIGKILKPGESAWFTGVTKIHYENRGAGRKDVNIVGAATTGMVLSFSLLYKFCGWGLDWWLWLFTLLVFHFHKINNHGINRWRKR